MNKAMLVKKATRLGHKVVFQFKKHLPEILIGAGIVTGVAGTVSACKATLTAKTVSESHKERIEEIHRCAETGTDGLTEETKGKELTIAYARTGLEYAKLYAPAVILGVTSVSCFVGSNNIMRRRNLALAAAYNTIDNTFKKYRGRTVERFGEQVDKELLYGMTAKKVIDEVVDENGEVHKVERTEQIVEEPSTPGYARYITPQDPTWDDNPLIMNAFFNAQQNYLNDLFTRQGYLFLNDAYTALEMQNSKAGQQVGWLYREINPSGDNFIQLYVSKVRVPVSKNPDDGYQDAYLVDFNVDGNILDKLDDEDYF